MELHTLPNNFETIKYWLEFSSFFFILLCFYIYIETGKVIYRIVIKYIGENVVTDFVFSSLSSVIIVLALTFATLPFYLSLINKYNLKYCTPIRFDKALHDLYTWKIYEKCELDNTDKSIVDMWGLNENYIGDQFENYEICREHIIGDLDRVADLDGLEDLDRVTFLLEFSKAEISEYNKPCDRDS